MLAYPIHIQIIVVGKLRQDFWRAAAEQYLGRLQHYAATSITEARDVLGRGRSESEAIAEESKEITRRLRPEALVILLDKDGKKFSSEQLAGLLKKEIEGGRRLLQFIIGGPAGVAPELRAGLRLSLSAMTLPHELARVVLLEQLYRAFTILRGEKYHK